MKKSIIITPAAFFKQRINSTFYNPINSITKISFELTMEVFGCNLCNTPLFFTIFTILIAYTYYSFKTFWGKQKIYEVPFKIAYNATRNFILHKEPGFQCWAKILDHLKEQKQKIGGFFIFSNAYLITSDVTILKDIMSSFYSTNFYGRGLIHNEKIDPLSSNILNLEGAKWKTVRSKLSPTFTTAKLKGMFEIVVELSKNIEDFVKEHSEANKDFDIKQLVMLYSSDAFASCAFGIETNSVKKEESEFINTFKSIFVRKTSDTIRMMFIKKFPKLSELLQLKICDPNITNFFLKVVKDMITYRMENNIVRNDFIQALMDEMDPEKAENPFTFTEAAAQAFAMFLAAYETTSTAMMYCLYEMCIKPEIQDRVRQEIKDIIQKHDNKITYDACQQMTYMKQVFNETLRHYPPIPTIPRKCYKDFQMPGTDSVIPKNSSIIIPIYYIHHDPEYYPNPDQFDPERWSEENKSNIAPFTFLPFGEGPRICIGMRFSQMQIPLVLSRLLLNYKFTLSSKTKLPLVFEKNSAVSLDIVGGIYLKAEKI